MSELALPVLLAGALAGSCFGVAWRAYRRAGAARDAAARSEADALEARLAEKELGLRLRLARRNVQALGRAALFGGTGLAFWQYAAGGAQPLVAAQAFLLGFAGWVGCGELHRRLGSLADSWRAAVERGQRRGRQGVDPSSGTR